MKYVIYPKTETLIHCESGIAKTTEHYHVRRTMKQSELMIVVEGEMDIRHLEEYHLSAGEIFILPQGVEHYGTKPCSYTIHWFHFILPSSFQIIEESELLKIDDQQYFIFPIQFKINNLNSLLFLAYQLEQYPTVPATNYVRNALFNAIMYEINLQNTDYQYGRYINHKRLNSIINYININIQANVYDSLNIKSTAEYFNYNEKYIFNLFKTYLGTSPRQYIINQKMNTAKSMLLNTNDTIASIALTLKYDNPQYFMRQFKKTFGVTPTEMRNSFSHSLELYLNHNEKNSTK